MKGLNCLPPIFPYKVTYKLLKLIGPDNDVLERLVMALLDRSLRTQVPAHVSDRKLVGPVRAKINSHCLQR